MGPNLFVHNENSAYVMPRVTAHAYTMQCGMQASQPPLCKCRAPEITYGHAIHASQTISNKMNCITV